MINTIAMKRWCVTVTYRYENGKKDKNFLIEELEELSNIIESGPDWNTIHKIKIKLHRRTQYKNLTVEESEKI